MLNPVFRNDGISNVLIIRLIQFRNQTPSDVFGATRSFLATGSTPTMRGVTADAKNIYRPFTSGRRYRQTGSDESLIAPFERQHRRLDYYNCASRMNASEEDVRNNR